MSADLIARFDALRDSGICSPTTRALLNDAQAKIKGLEEGWDMLHFSCDNSDHWAAYVHMVPFVFGDAA